MAPVPEPPIKSEEHWSDPELQKSKGNWYGYTKTTTEKFFQKHAEANGKYRFAAICPTGVFGPMLQPTVNATMGWVLGLYKNGKDKAANDSMSFIDVRDCAAHHVAALENPEATGRYMSLVESLHWNDIFVMMKELHPGMPDVPKSDGEPITPTQFDLTKMNSLGVEVRSVREVLQGCLEEFKAKGLL